MASLRGKFEGKPWLGCEKLQIIENFMLDTDDDHMESNVDRSW